VGFLDGIRVVDATRLLPGGYCSMLLSDMGAQVVKVEQPGLGDYLRATPPTKQGESPVHMIVNRNKRSIGIDLKKPEGKQVMSKLLGYADVFIEGFRPGAVRRLGFSFGEVAKVNPRIVYCSISAYGQASGFSRMPGHDINFQAMAGTLSYHRRPAVPQLQLGDMASGMFAAVGILGALASKNRPVFVDVPIVQSLLSWMVIPVSAYLATGHSPWEGHSLVFGSTPYYNIYLTSDKRYIAVAAIEQEFWHNLITALGVPRLEQMRFGSRAERSAVTKTLRRIFATKTRDEWAKLLMRRDTCATPVLSLDEAVNSGWARDSSMLIRVRGDGAVLNQPVMFAPPSRSTPFAAAPSLGEDTAAIMRELGYARTDISRLREAGAIQ
jgi:crotonobetainyl-CoA:carnitine CoA-transferase CaiB-like acyl-CoA transferase